MDLWLGRMRLAGDIRLSAKRLMEGCHAANELQTGDIPIKLHEVVMKLFDIHRELLELVDDKSSPALAEHFSHRQEELPF